MSVTVVTLAGETVVRESGGKTILTVDTEEGTTVVSRDGVPGPQGPPGTSGTSFEHTQGSASAVWTVNHNLGFRPDVEVRNAGGVVVWCELIHTSINQVVAYFATAISGTARCS